MKKYVFLIVLSSLVLLSPKASPMNPSGDTIVIKDGLKLDLRDLEKLKNLKLDFDIPDMSDFKLKFDTSQLSIQKLKFDEKTLKIMADMGISFLEPYSGEIPQNITIVKQNTTQTPTRTETKVFTGISDIEIDHKYGDIVVRESNSKQIDVEIQYFDTKTEKATCDVSTSKGILSIITTTPGSKNGSMPKINYILSVPRGTALNVNLKYGNIRLDEHKGKFTGNLSYSNLNAKSFDGEKPQINIRYGNINIDNVTDISLTASYSKTKITEAGNIEIIDSKYSDYSLDKVESLRSGKSLSYNNFKIGTIYDMSVNMKYTDVKIEDLVSSLVSDCAYSDIIAKTTGKKLNNITIDGSYSDLMIMLPEGESVGFDASLSYGDLDISKKHKVTYTRQESGNFNVRKSGIIGNSKNPKAFIKITNKYADIRIR